MTSLEKLKSVRERDFKKKKQSPQCYCNNEME